MNKFSSILDYQKSELCPEVWANNELKPEVKKFILDCLHNFFTYKGLKGSSKWIVEGLLASSLATYFYTEYSDLDIKIFIDLVLFIEYNQDFLTYTDNEILDWLKDQKKQSFWLSQLLPNTEHPIDIYFISAAELNRLNILRYDSLYVLSTDEWIKEPMKLIAGLSPSYILEVAKQKAEPYIEVITKDIEKAKRDCIDFLVLRDFLKTLEVDDLYYLQQEFSNKLDIINNDIIGLVQDKEAIKELRNVDYTKDYLDTELEKLMGSLSYSNGNLIFKLIQRYGYLKILVEISEYFKRRDIYPKDIETILSLLNKPNERKIFI